MEDVFQTPVLVLELLQPPHSHWAVAEQTLDIQALKAVVAKKW
jgi:hypothetical protein